MTNHPTLSLIHQVQFEDDFLFVNKPAGFSSHAPDQGKLGFVEILQKELGRKLFVVHRLDKFTTGAMVFAMTQQKAQLLSELFKLNKVSKTYLFLSPHANPTLPLGTALNSPLALEDHPSDLVKMDLNSFEVIDLHSKTIFRKVQTITPATLWEARPYTGKYHQIRIHSSRTGIPILGDEEYGGPHFPHLCLHSQKIEFMFQNQQYCYEAQPPLFFDEMELIKNPWLIKILSAIDRRQRLYNFQKLNEQCLRLVHIENKNSELTLDQLGSHLWLTWYKQSNPNEGEVTSLKQIELLLKKKIFFRKKQPTDKAISDENTSWVAKENHLSFLFKLDSGWSPGLFLDQRANRKWVESLSHKKSVLNLFSYTCGFSVAAAFGGATKVTSVDMSKKYLLWGKENFTLNQIDTDLHEFFRQDSSQFIDRAIKIQRKWDLIIVDPPSFSRNKNQFFQIEKDLPIILKNVGKILNSNGILLVCCNYEKWSQNTFRSIVINSLSKSKEYQFHETEAPSQWDFETPQEPRLMKCLTLTAKNKNSLP